jgi:hypothetical protein
MTQDLNPDRHRTERAQEPNLAEAIRRRFAPLGGVDLEMVAYADSAMPRDEISQPFFLIVADHDRGVFAVEGPMTDDRRWKEAAKFARNNQHRITCGPTGPDRDALAVEFRSASKLAGVPPGSILRPRP